MLLPFPSLVCFDRSMLPQFIQPICQVLEKQKTLTCRVHASLGPRHVMMIMNLLQSVAMYAAVTHESIRDSSV